MEKNERWYDINLYIEKLETGLSDFFSLWEDQLNQKQNNSNITHNIEVIEKQLNTIQKVIKHAKKYREKFLYEIYPELLAQWHKENIRKEIKLYLIQNITNSKLNKKFYWEKKYPFLLKKNKKLLHNLNIHVDSFILSLTLIEQILQKQYNFLVWLKNLNIKQNNKYWKFLKKIINIKWKFENKIMWDFKKNLEEEKKIFKLLEAILQIKDLNVLYKYEKFIEKNLKIQNYIQYWIWLNLLPEEWFSDILAIFSYIYAFFLHLQIKSSKFNKEKIKKQPKS